MVYEEGLKYHPEPRVPASALGKKKTPAPAAAPAKPSQEDVDYKAKLMKRL